MTAPRHISVYTPQNVAADHDGRLFSPNFDTNFAPIRDSLRQYLDGRCGTVLEIGSGTGQHIAHLAGAFPGLTWVPSDIHPQHLASIRAWRAHLRPANLAEPALIDASTDWAGSDSVRALGPLDAVLCANVLHIAPWAVAEGLVRGAAQVLKPGGVLILYGAFREEGRHTAASNAAFDAALRAENPDWGVRDLEAVAALAVQAGLDPPGITRMPSNNLMVAFARP